MERKHKAFRYYANNLKVLKHFDKSVLRNLTVEHLHSLETYEKFSEGASLICSRTPSKKLLRQLHVTFGMRDGLVIKTARKARVNMYEKVCVGDVVFFSAAGQRQAGMIVMHASVQQDADSIAAAMSFLQLLVLKSRKEGSCEVGDVDKPVIVPAADIRKSCIWAKSNGVTIIVT